MQINEENRKKIIICILLIIFLIISFVIYIIIENTNSDNEGISLESMLDVDEKNLVGDNNVIEDNNGINNIIEEKAVEEVEKKEEIAVHIIGAVKKEGIIYLEKGARIIDAIKKAGGETSKADLSKVNLAYQLQDGQKIYIPSKNDKNSEYIIESGGNNENIDNNNGKEKKVNINTANQNELDSLPGIGPSIAERIIEYRQENGNFSKIEDLQNVKGIGDAKFQDIKEYVTV